MNVSDLQVFLLDTNPEMTTAWKRHFVGVDRVEVVNSDFGSFMGETAVDYIVSPGNSYGLMDGGYDRAISDYFGAVLQEKVQQCILRDWGGEQTPGTSLLVAIPGTDKWLIHAPTMRIPSLIADPWVVEKCTRTALAVACRGTGTRIVLPGFGAGTGSVDPRAVAGLMRLAYERLASLPEKIDWNYALSFGEEA